MIVRRTNLSVGMRQRKGRDRIVRPTDLCSPSILPVHPAVGNPVGDVVEIGHAERYAKSEGPLVCGQVVAGSPEVELQRLTHELPPTTGRIAQVIRRWVVGPAIRIRESPDID